MCVIALKPKHVTIAFDTVQKMWESNPHGAGFAIVHRQTTTIMKGYETPLELYQDIARYQDKALVIHFRFATHGETSKEMTHPFTITSDLDTSLSLGHVTELPILFHNGVINGFGNSVLSDTLDFTLKVLAPMSKTEDIRALLSLMPGKYALIHEGHIALLGGFEKYKGLKVSNTYFDYVGYQDENAGYFRKIGIPYKYTKC